LRGYYVEREEQMVVGVEDVGEGGGDVDGDEQGRSKGV
jgi:hypothetical protein